MQDLPDPALPDAAIAPSASTQIHQHLETLPLLMRSRRLMATNLTLVPL